MSTKKTEERKEVNPKETEVWTVHANNPRKHELNRACITTRHPCSNNKSRPNNITERQKDRLWAWLPRVVARFDRERWRRQLLSRFVSGRCVATEDRVAFESVTCAACTERADFRRVLLVHADYNPAHCSRWDRLEPRRIRSWTMIVFRESGRNGNIRGEEDCWLYRSRRVFENACRSILERL